MASAFKPTTLKVSTINLNNNADSNKEKEKDTSPTLQVKDSINTHLHSLRSGNLAQKVSFKSKDDIPGTSSHQNLNSLFSRSNSNEPIEDFNTKTKEITKAMLELHFSTVDLRNKLSKGRLNNNCPIITQVIERNNMTTAAQVRVEIYPPSQSCW